jgi:hypothetical protein
MILAMVVFLVSYLVGKGLLRAIALPAGPT